MVATAPTQQKQSEAQAGTYYVALDGLRGLAVLAVVAEHFGVFGFRGGFFGLEIFFVLSGFVVSRNLLRSVGEKRWLRHFFFRRVTRLLPVLAVALLVVAAIYALDGSVERGERLALLTAALQVYNFGSAYLLMDQNFLLHLWSLSIEFQYYLLAPLLIWAAQKLNQPSLLGLLGAVVISIVLFRLLALDTGTPPFRVYLDSRYRFDGLLLGTMIAIALPLLSLEAVPKAVRQRLDIWGTMGLAVVLALIPLAEIQENPKLFYGVGFIVAGLSTAIVVLAVVVHNDRKQNIAAWQRLLESKYLVMAGQRSYSLYVWHYILGVGLISQGSLAFQGVPLFAAQLGLSFLCAEASFRFLERPARRYLNKKLIRLES